MISLFHHALIIKLRHHGDVLLTTPLISALHHYFPGIQVDALVYLETADILRYNSEVHQLHTIDRKSNRQSFSNRLKNEYYLARALRSQHYDLIIHLTESWRGAFMCKLLRPKRSIAFAFPRRNNLIWNSCFTDLIPMPTQPLHNVEWQLSTLSAFKISLDNERLPLHLEIDPTAQNHVSELLIQSGWKGEPYILIHPGSRWFFKCWEDHRYPEVIDALRQQGYAVVLTAAPDKQERKILDNIYSDLSSTDHVYSLAGQLTLAELAAAIGNAVLFIGVDSVPMHMAAALQIPSVALFGPSKVHEWSPWQSPTQILHAAQWGEIPDPDTIHTGTGERYLSAIPTDAVINAALKQLSLYDSKKDPVCHR